MPPFKDDDAECCGGTCATPAAAEPERSVTIEGIAFTESDARRLEQQAAASRKHAQHAADMANVDEDLALRIRQELERTKPKPVVTIVSVDRDKDAYQFARLSNGDTVSILGRGTGEYEGRGFYLSYLPDGHEWVVVKDSRGVNTLIIRPIAPNVLGAPAMYSSSR